MGTKLHGIDTTEEMIMNENFGQEYGKLRRWRINYLNEEGHSNIEGTVYLPDDVDPYPTLDKICELIAEEFKRSKGE